MAFFAALLASVVFNYGIYVLQGLLADRQRGGDQRPGFPTADPEKFLPIIFGTVRLPLNMFRVGRTYVDQIEKKANFGFGLDFGVYDIIGYRHYYTMAGWLCHGPLAGVCDIIVDGKYFLSRITPQQLRDADGIDGTVEVTVSDSRGNSVNVYSPLYVTYGPITGLVHWFLGKHPNGAIVDVTIPALFGDPVREGGVQGRMRIYPGDGSHLPNAVMQAPNAMPLGYVDWEEPPYPEYAYVVFEDFWLGNSGNPPGIEVVVARGTIKLSFGNPLYGYPDSPFGGAQNGFGQGDVNPIGAIYEILVNKKLMIGFPRALIDVGSFEGAYFATNPDTAGEFAGVSGVIDSPAAAEETIKTLLAHVDAVLFLSPTTGLLTIRLIREFGGDPTSLPLLDDSNLLSFDWEETIQNEAVNEIIVEFTNVYRNLTIDTVRVQNLAAIQRAGRRNSLVMQFHWATRHEFALKLAQRELRVQTSKIGRGNFTMKRGGMFFTPGQHVRITSPEHGLENMVCRIGNIDIGNMADGKITGTVIQDRFFSEESSYEAPTSSDPDVVQPVQYRAPKADAFIGFDNAEITDYNLLVTDPDSVVTAVEYTVGNGDPTSLTWTLQSGPPYWFEVLKSPVEEDVWYKVTYDGPDGLSQYFIGKYPKPTPIPTAMPAPSLSYEYSGTDVIVTVEVAHPTGTIAFDSGSTPPTEADLNLVTPDPVPPQVYQYTLPAPTGMALLYVAARSGWDALVSPIARLVIPAEPTPVIIPSGERTIQYPFGNGSAMGVAGDWMAASPSFPFSSIKLKVRALKSDRTQANIDATFTVKKVRESDGALIDMVGGVLTMAGVSEATFDASTWAVPDGVADDEIIVTLETMTNANSVTSLLATLAVEDLS